ncbi:MAG: hypothetical protein DMG30_29280 [Acidobacteria bacterium]|nr:MAG: hypothetical protein DMG30_29280 [Acidobacteriota bacterium]
MVFRLHEHQSSYFIQNSVHFAKHAESRAQERIPRMSAPRWFATVLPFADQTFDGHKRGAVGVAAGTYSLGRRPADSPEPKRVAAQTAGSTGECAAAARVGDPAKPTQT